MTEQSQDLAKVTEERNLLQSALDRAKEHAEELGGELATARKELHRRETTVADLTAQVEELSVSPLDLTQQQRAKALTLAREVVAETGSAGMFTKTTSAKVSLAGVLSTAHFIVSGDRDYVTVDGEYVLDDTHPARPARVDAGHTSTEVGPGSPAPHSDLDQPEVDDGQ